MLSLTLCLKGEPGEAVRGEKGGEGDRGTPGPRVSLELLQQNSMFHHSFRHGQDTVQTEPCTHPTYCITFYDLVELSLTLL